MKLLLMCVALLTYWCAPAQVRWGVNAGLQYDVLSRYADINEKSELGQAGMHIGTTVNLPLSETGSFETGIRLSTRGGFTAGRSVRVIAAEVPLHVLVHHGGFFAGGGPGFIYGIIGRGRKTKLGEAAVDVYDAKSFIYLKRFDVQLSGVLGYSFKNNVQFSVFIANGMLNLHGHKDEPYFKSRLRSTGATIGYRF